MKQDQNAPETDDSTRLGDDIEISDEEMPKSKEEWDERYAQEKKLREQIRQELPVSLMRVDLDELIQAIKTYHLEKVIMDWANIHRGTRAMLIKKGGADIVSTPMSEILLEAANVLKN